MLATMFFFFLSPATVIISPLFFFYHDAKLNLRKQKRQRKIKRFRNKKREGWENLVNSKIGLHEI